MSIIPAFPKIHALGSRENQGIFDGEVEITEKIDGSAIAFGVIDGKLHVRSKSREIDIDNPDKMFALGVGIILGLLDKLLPEFVYYGEYLRDRRHNVLMYDSAPKGNIMLYGIAFNGKQYRTREFLESAARDIGLDVVPLLFKGKEITQQGLTTLLTRTSALGGAQIEGIVVKNYNKQHLMMGKYVNEKFKEISGGSRGPKTVGQTRFDSFKAGFRTEARWHKAIQHLKDNGELTDSPADIGKLLKEINLDIIAEEKENIKEWLWDEFGKQVLKAAGEGFPTFYKNMLQNCTDSPILRDIEIDLGGS